MFAGNWLTLGNFIRAAQRESVASTGRFLVGTYLGIVAVSMWQQFSLTYGLDSVLLLATGLILAIAFGLGQRWSLKHTDAPWNHSFSYLLCCLSAWSILHPFWIDAMTTFMGFVPMTWLESPIVKPLVALAIAVSGWLLPGMLWGAVLTHGSIRKSSARQGTPLVGLGMVFGLLLNAVVVAPISGVFVPTIVACVLAIGFGLRLRLVNQDAAESNSTGQIDISRSQSNTLLIRIGMSLVMGGLLACQMRLINQLMPHGAFVLFVQAAGVIAGFSIGVCFDSVRRGTPDRAAWYGLFTAAASSLLLAAQPSLVDLSLWMNSTLTNVTWLMAARVLLLIVTMFPFGIAMAGIGHSNDGQAVLLPAVLGMLFQGKKESDEYGTSSCRGSDYGHVPAVFLLGVTFATFFLGGMVALIPMMVGCSGLLLLAAVSLRVRSSGWVISIPAASVGGCMLAIALSLPLWRSYDDASRTAKVLFSTPAFVAYRSGWDVNQLSALDDLRLIHRQESSNGSLTLWRGRVAELYLRESGIPRSVLTKTPEVVPQFAPEVLQAVYSLVLSDRPGRVMLLGLSAGVPLSTCLEFPVREVVCVEGDSGLIDMVQGPITRETGFNPLIDDRVTLRRVSPEIALMTKHDEPFDVILSSPPSSSMTGGASNFTSEFFSRAASHLSERGLFCQRFECIDYGPEPLQIVLKSMRQAFKQVIAIETAAGELLLFGANSEDVFIPSDLASRLELPHVLRILARSGLDWSTLLNQPAYDHEALGEICGESRRSAGSIFNGSLGSLTPLEVMRWGNKQQEVQAILTTTRLTKAPFWTEAGSGEPKQLDAEVHLSRRSRLVEWLGDSRVSLETLRRLNEVTTQQKLVHENPDAHWWEYRKALRQQIQDRPRTAVQQVKAIDEKPTLHPEDVRRRDYFVVLGNAVNRKKTPTRKEIAAVEEYLEPYDPLLSYFARQEIADLLARCQEDPGRELAYRLHVIFFAPTRDSSVRNVATALETLVRHPDAIPDDSTRFDALNGLIQTMRSRWETRQFIGETSAKKVIEDVDKSLIAVEKGVSALDELALTAGVSENEWKIRKQVIERLLLRPLRTYRAEIESRLNRSQMHARAIFDNATRTDSEEGRE